jgi:Bax protein
LFGQKTTNKERNMKSETDSYAAFNHFEDSIEAYMRNLNTHNAYDEFREKRAKIGAGKVKELLPTLINYSIKGKGYVKEINRMIVDNGFERYS